MNQDELRQRARKSAQSVHTGHFSYTQRRALLRRRRMIVKKKESADKPGSVEDNHSSAIRVAAYLQRPTREHVWATRATRPRTSRLLPYLVLLRAGFAVPPSVATGAVRSYRTISPLPPPLQGGWRFAFCCTFRGLAPPRRYLAPCPGSPDFPPRLRAAIVWPTPVVMVGAIGKRSKLFAEPQRGFVQLAALAAGDMRRDFRGLRWRQLLQQSA
jgi:hypothetical protein